MPYPFLNQVELYHELVIELQVGGRGNGDFVANASATDLRHQLRELPRRLYVTEEDVRNFYSATATPSSRMPLKELGARLFTSLFEGELGSLRDEARAYAMSQAFGLQIRLRFRSPVSPLVDFPWETMLDTGRGEFVALLGADAVARAIGAARHPPDDMKPSILVVGVQVGSIFNVKDEVDQLRSALEPTGVPFHYLENPSADTLRAEIGYRRPTILHYIGPAGDGWGRSGEAILVMAEESGRALDPRNVQRLQGASVEQFSAMFAEPPRLVCLNACRSARFAAGLAANVPAVVALNGDVPDSECVSLAGILFRRLARGANLMAAIAATRQELATRASNAWNAAVLYGWEGSTPLLAPAKTQQVVEQSFATAWGSRDDRKRELKRRALQRNLHELRQQVDACSSPPGELKSQLEALEAELLSLNESTKGTSP